MRLNLKILALTIYSQSAFAFQFKTVMGGCPSDAGVVTSPHMRADVAGKKVAVVPTKPDAVGSTGVLAKFPAKK